MRPAWLGLIELFVVLMFVAGWGILELVTLRMDRRRAAQEGAASPRAASPADAVSKKDAPRHPER